MGHMLLGSFRSGRAPGGRDPTEAHLLVLADVAGGPCTRREHRAQSPNTHLPQPQRPPRAFLQQQGGQHHAGGGAAHCLLVSPLPLLSPWYKGRGGRLAGPEDRTGGRPPTLAHPYAPWLPGAATHQLRRQHGQAAAPPLTNLNGNTAKQLPPWPAPS